MPTLRQYLEQKYGTPAGYAPLPRISIQQDHSKPTDPLLLTSSSISAANNPDLPSQPSSLPAASPEAELDAQVSGAESDTEVEDNTEVEKYYLTRTRGTRRDINVGTVFGEGIRVWIFHQGTAYTHIEGELVEGEVVMPRIRKRVQRSTVSRLGKRDDDGSWNEHVVTVKDDRVSEQTPLVLEDTTPTPFHHRSTSTTPLCALACALPRTFNQRTSEPYKFYSCNPSTAHARTRRRVSGSFGTFEVEHDRFSARPYRLLQMQSRQGCEEGKEEREKEMGLDEEEEGEDVHRGRKRWLHKLGGGV